MHSKGQRLAGLVMVLLAVLGTCSKVYGQYAGYQTVSNLPAFRKKFAEESSRINTIVSDFRQDKILTALTEKMTSSGSFKFKRNNKVRIEYVRPFSYLMVMNGDKMLVRDDQKENRINVKSNKLFQQVNRIMLDCIQGTILESKDFTVKVFENESTVLLEMTPGSKTVKDFFSTIVLTVEKKDYSVKTIEMNEPAGDKTIMVFSNKKINVAVGDEVFAF